MPEVLSSSPSPVPPIAAFKLKVKCLILLCLPCHPYCTESNTCRVQSMSSGLGGVLGLTDSPRFKVKKWTPKRHPYPGRQKQEQEGIVLVSKQLAHVSFVSFKGNVLTGLPSLRGLQFMKAYDQTLKTRNIFKVWKQLFRNALSVQNTAGTTSPTGPLDSSYSTQAAVCPLEKEKSWKTSTSQWHVRKVTNVCKSGDKGRPAHTSGMSEQAQANTLKTNGTNLEREWKEN